MSNTSECGHGIKKKREGRIQSAERARAHPIKQFEGYEPSFSLIGADSRHAVKGDSYVRRTSLTAPSQPRTVQETRQRPPARVQVGRPPRNPRLGCTLGGNTCPSARASDHSGSSKRDSSGYRTSRTA